MFTYLVKIRYKNGSFFSIKRKEPSFLLIYWRGKSTRELTLIIETI